MITIDHGRRRPNFTRHTDSLLKELQPLVFIPPGRLFRNTRGSKPAPQHPQYIFHRHPLHSGPTPFKVCINCMRVQIWSSSVQASGDRSLHRASPICQGLGLRTGALDLATSAPGCSEAPTNGTRGPQPPKQRVPPPLRPPKSAPAHQPPPESSYSREPDHPAALPSMTCYLHDAEVSGHR